MLRARDGSARLMWNAESGGLLVYLTDLGLRLQLLPPEGAQRAFRYASRATSFYFLDVPVAVVDSGAQKCRLSIHLESLVPESRDSQVAQKGHFSFSFFIFRAAILGSGDLFSIIILYFTFEVIYVWPLILVF